MIKQIHYNDHTLDVHVKDAKETVQKSWSWGVFNDMEELKIVEIVCKTGSIVDIGAGIGNHTLFYSKVMGRKCISFEPDAAKFDMLRKNVILNNPRTALYNYALSDYAGKARKESGDEIVYFKSSKEVFNVQVNILSSFVWEPVGLVRVNVPEKEILKVLSGGKRVLKESKPHLFIKTDNPDEVLAYLADAMKLKYMVKQDFGKTKYFKPI